jgi:hypothetical protein
MDEKIIATFCLCDDRVKVMHHQADSPCQWIICSGFPYANSIRKELPLHISVLSSILIVKWLQPLGA